jgi:DNA mismatch repair protein MutH
LSRQLSLIDQPEPLSRAAALVRLEALIGTDLRPLADTYGITVWREGRRNKGWAGQVVERVLGQSPNSKHGADFGDWELKVVPLVFNASGGLRLKETMGLTMFTAEEIETQAFEDSHLFEKLARIVVVARVYEDASESRSLVATVAPFDLTDPQLYAEIQEDYEELQWVVRQSGVHALDGTMGRWVQPRPKGDAKRAGVGFYARKALVSLMLGLG